MSSGDYELIDCTCPKCGCNPIHERECNNLMCTDGFEDEHDNDPTNFAPGEVITPCPECKGTGFKTWCPECGAELSGHHFPYDKYDQP